MNKKPVLLLLKLSILALLIYLTKQPTQEITKNEVYGKNLEWSDIETPYDFITTATPLTNIRS